MIPRLLRAPALLAALAVGASPALADPEGGTVSGNVKLPSPELRGEAPHRGRGFLERMPNPLKSPEPFNPLPDLVVILDGGTPHPDDTKPRRVRYLLRGESFEAPVFPVVVGATIEIENRGRRWPRLTSPTMDGLIDSEPPLPGKDRRRLNKTIDTPYKAVVIRDLDAPHLVGRIVAVPHNYFSRVDDAGRFEIGGVPAGRWNVRVWYREGWVEMGEINVEVRAKGTAKVTIDLPAKPAPTPADD